MKKALRHGFTTGACATAAARGAALMIARQELVSEVIIELPTGAAVTFQLHGQTFSKTSAACFVIKDAGDDPDVTNGAELHAAVALTPAQKQRILITGGTGIGKVTKPGLAVAPGEWAINPVPRSMIAQAVREAFSLQPNPPQSPLIRGEAEGPSLIRGGGGGVSVVISIPDGEVRAQKTLNARLGIIGGLSILGTTGIVRPISAKAWTDTIDAALDVARACGCPTVVLSTGRTSELAAQRYLDSNPPPALPYQGGGLSLPPDKGGLRGVAFPEEAFIMMGDHVAYALRACQQRGFDRPMLACQFAKLLKIACGHENTHAAASELDLATLREWAKQQGLPVQIMDLVANANTAREIIIASGFDPVLLELVCRHAHQAVHDHAPDIVPSFLVADYSGNIVFSS